MGKQPITPHSIGDLLRCRDDGTPVVGTATKILDYGVEVDFGFPVNALLHLVDINWGRVHHPGDYYAVGDKVTAVVLQLDKTHRRVSLGVKQLSGDPLDSLSRGKLVGEIFDGVVTAVVDYGIFCEIYPGVEGLVHIGELSWTNTNIKPDSLAKVGDPIRVMVTEFHAVGRRLSLSIKRLSPNPWEEFRDKWQPGDILYGKVRSITGVGVFVGLPGGLDGLVTAIPSGRTFAKGDMIAVMVKIVIPKRGRIVLRLAGT